MLTETKGRSPKFSKYDETIFMSDSCNRSWCSHCKPINRGSRVFKFYDYLSIEAQECSSSMTRNVFIHCEVIQIER